MFALCLLHSSKMGGRAWSRGRDAIWSQQTADLGRTLSILCPISEVVVRCCEEECLVLAGHCAAFLNRVTPVWRTAAEEHSLVQCNAVCISVLCNIIRFKKIQDPKLKSLTSLPGTHSRTYFLKETKCSLAATAENICLVLTITGSGVVSQ